MEFILGGKNEWTAFPGRTKNGWINLQPKNQQGQRLNCSFAAFFLVGLRFLDSTNTN